MNDRELLKKIGLSDEEIRDLLKKLHAFVGTLNPKQKRAFEKSLLPSREAAARRLKDISPEQLEEFIRDRSPKGSSMCIYLMVGGGDGD